MKKYNIINSKIYKFIFIVVLVWLSFFTIDYVLFRFNKKPVFSIPLKIYKDGGTVEYYGLGYKIIKYNVLDNKITGTVGRKDLEFGFWNLEYSEINS